MRAGPGDEPLAGIPLQQLGVPLGEGQVPSPPQVLAQASQPPVEAERADSFAFSSRPLPSQVPQSYHAVPLPFRMLSLTVSNSK